QIPATLVAGDAAHRHEPGLSDPHSGNRFPDAGDALLLYADIVHPDDRARPVADRLVHCLVPGVYDEGTSLVCLARENGREHRVRLPVRTGGRDVGADRTM